MCCECACVFHACMCVFVERFLDFDPVCVFMCVSCVVMCMFVCVKYMFETTTKKESERRR